MEILEKIRRGNYDLPKSEIRELLDIDNYSDEFYDLICLSNKLSRSKFKNKGYVFAQIGINAEPCSKNCKFCSMGMDHYSVDSKWRKDIDTIELELDKLLAQGIDDFFLMTTADYPIEKFIKISSKIRKRLPESNKFVANIGDFDYETAKKLKEIGFTGAYHINRLREGKDTLIDSRQREITIANIIKAGLELYYCIEPIGPEHDYDEIVEEILRAQELKIGVMAVMRRIPVPGTPLFSKGKISAVELTKIAAVANLAVNPSRAMNVHEPTQMALLAGVNQLYAEVGANPRDIKGDTEENRGFDPLKAWEMLEEGGYHK
jgi:biotin synthase